jgi:hypothetical protein
MTKEFTKQLSLDRPATYQIKVPGVIDVRLADWAGEMVIRSRVRTVSFHSPP